MEEKTTLGFLRFLPIYKPISIYSEVSYQWNNPLKKSGIKNASLDTETFIIKGQFNIFGTWSIKKAELEAQNIINKSIQNKIKSSIRKELNPIKKTMCLNE